MKRLLSILLVITSLFVSCENLFRDEIAQLHKEIDAVNVRLDEFCNKTNENIAALQTMILALQEKDYVTNVSPVLGNGVEVGYQITFEKSGKVTIYHGKDGANGADGVDGKDGYTPHIGVKLHTDGLYYWTLDGEWLTDEEGNMIKAVGIDGINGSDGKDGEDGATGPQGEQGPQGEPGMDAPTPQLKIEDGNWYISVDGGKTWDYLGKATGEDGEDGATGPQGEQGPQGEKGDKGDQGDSIFSDVEITEEHVIITLADGKTQIVLPTWAAFNALKTQVDKLNADMAALQALVAAWEANDYVKSVTPLPDGSGYILTFVHSGTVTIYHGKDGSNGSDGAPGQDGANGTDGKDGHSPVISVEKDADGVWYWTIDGEWLLDSNGNKVKAVGTDGHNGANGSNGADGYDGIDGKDGITPKFKIENGMWYVSYDECKTWELAGQATGGQGGAGEAGDSMFAAVDSSNSDFIIIALTDGRTLKFPTWSAFESLKALCNEMNTNIASLQSIVSALQNNDYVTGVTEITDNGKVIGYTIHFSKSAPAVIYHGKDGVDGTPGQDGDNGKDGYVPKIGMKQDTDGVWYWTHDGEWLLDDNGQKVKASAKDGTAGSDGSNGKDGVSPKLKIDGGNWYVSYDNGATWTYLAQATGDKGDVGETGPQGPAGPQGPTGPQGPAGENGDSMLGDIEITAEYIIITLADGVTKIQLPTWKSFSELAAKVELLNADVAAIKILVEAWNQNDYIKSVTVLADGSGYMLEFVKSGKVTIYHGKNGSNGSDGAPGQDGSNGSDGKDGHSPEVSVGQDTDGVWYWTIDGEWLLDGSGNKVVAVGKDGAPGQNGANGTDGITPKFKIEDGFWYVSYDNCATWEIAGQATGNTGGEGAAGDSLFAAVDSANEDFIVVVLTDGRTLKFPTWKAFEELKVQCNQMNTNISSILALISSNDYVTGVSEIWDNGEVIGYTISFTKSKPIVIYHGKNGSDGKDGLDGYVPNIGLKQDTDGVWYWILDGEWLLDGNGQKVKASAKDGVNGTNGSNGQDGSNGKDGVTPRLKIDGGYWYISYDNGTSWEIVGQATGDKGDIGATGPQGPEGPQGPTGPEGPQGPAGTDGDDGKDGDTLISDIEITDDYVLITLADGQLIQIPTWAAHQALEQKVNQLNTNIESIQTILTALQNNDYVTGVTKIYEGGKEIGYTINFSKSGSVTIYHGKDGQNGSNGTNGTDGRTPAIAVKQDTDGVWYWTLDGEWLLDGNGQKVKASAKDGANGTNGSNGQDGSNGKDGVTPRLKIDGGYWYISYDNGTTWEAVGQATGDKGDIGETGPEGPQGPTGPEGPQGPAGSDGEDGKDGDTLISDIEITDDYVLITLADGKQIQIPTWAAHQALEQKVNQMNTNIEAIQTILTALQNNDYVTGVTKIYEGGKEIGYTITFSKSGSVTIYHGKDGQNGSNGTNGTDGRTPAIAVKQDTDGIWYWTIDGEWLLDSNGNKVKSVGTDGQNGANGSNGTDGVDGKDGVTPMLKIENGYWYVSYDNGKTWEDEPLGQATGDKGDSIFNDIDCSNEDYVFITLSDGQTIKLPTWGAKEAISNIVSNVRSMIYIPQYSDGQTRVKDGVTEFDFQILPKKYASVVAENWESLLSIKSTYAITRAMTFNDLPILSCVADETNGIVTLTVSCASLSIEYYYGAQSVNAALYLSNGNEEIASEYISFAPYYQPDEMWYTTTDGKIVTPYDANALDVTIISNTYENGKGVIKFDGDLTNIGKNAFKSKKTLSSVMIPHKVTTINDSAFGSCTSLMKIYCKPSDPPAIYLYYKFYYESLSSTLRSVFERISGMKIYVPAKYYEKYAAYTGVSTSNSDKVMQDNWGAYHSYIEPLYLLEE